jgi:small-conductance mechanosensitive channel
MERENAITPDGERFLSGIFFVLIRFRGVGIVWENQSMATSPNLTPSAGKAPTPEPLLKRIFGRTRLIALGILLAVIVLLVGFTWSTRDSMQHLPFLNIKSPAGKLAASQKTLVDLSPWQTASALAPLAVTNEEQQYAQEAERLADHEVDQAFASALRKATVQVQTRVLTGDALSLSQRVDQLQELVKEDKAQVQDLSPAPGNTGKANDGDPIEDTEDDLEIAKAQLGLDTDQLTDAQEDLARASGDNRAQIQSELQEHEAAMKKYDSGGEGKKQVAVLSASNYGTLAALIGAYNSQRTREHLLGQAAQQAETDIAQLMSEHNALEVQANALAAATPAATADHAAKLASLRQRAAERQLLSIYDDRIQTQQRLKDIYTKWSAQVELQHRILLHLILQAVAWIAFLIVCILVADALLVRLMSRPTLDPRRTQTLRKILQLGIQTVGIIVVLLVIFGTPRQMPTILGLATAGLTVVLQDFIIAFFGWFVLMGKNGIRVGDWVEINGVGGEVTEIGLFRTTLLETGNWTDKGHPTGRRVTFINSFAIRGQYFNFSTTGQWMWDEISVSVPAGEDTYAMVEDIHKAVVEETGKDATIAEQEWKRGSRSDGLSQFSADATVNLRPSASGVDVLVRYVTRASDRAEMRNKLFQRVLDVLRKPAAGEEADV